MRDELFIWFDCPPKVSRGAFNYVSQQWGNSVYYIIKSNFRTERKLASWDSGGFGKASVNYLFQMDNPDYFVEQLFIKHPSAIHIINGLDSQIERLIRPHIHKPGLKVVFSSERPVSLGGFFESLIRKVYITLKYNFKRAYYSKYVSALLPLGEKGRNVFLSFGWNPDVVFPFMYNPELPEIERFASNEKVPGECVHFLYVGRFSYRTKGVDMLMNATELLKGNWHLDIVGGYGDKKNEIIDWANGNSNVSFLGTWDSSSVSEHLLQYDVVIVPTRFDGWNLLINEAINSGVGVITTNEAVSDEVITNSGAGIVVDCSASMIAETMQSVIDDVSLVKKWHELAIAYKSKISSKTVGNYLIDILDYVFYDNPVKPEKPW